MIPYDDLVIALQTWRAKQGLPVAQMSGALTPPPVVAPKTAPPSPPPARPVTPPPLEASSETHEDSLDVDGALIEEAEQYENEGNDFAMAFGQETVDAPADSADDAGGTEVASPGARRGGTQNTNDW